MSKRVYIIHGWGGNPNEGWLVWLGKELKNRGFEVFIPEMPDTWLPKIHKWVSKISEVVGKSDVQTYFVGHSIGCQAVMRYLEQLPQDQRAGGAIFVAGWFNLTDETWDETYTKETADEWVNTPINFKVIKEHTDNLVLINSDNDPYVPMSDVELFKKNFSINVIILKNKGHITEEDNVVELPVVLGELLKMAQ